MSKAKGGLKEGELEFLVAFWQRIAEEFAETENLIFEWQNYMDTRRVIGKAIGAMSDGEKAEMELKINALDAQLIAKTFEISESIWGDDSESEDHYDREIYWFYYRMNEPVFQAENGRFTRKG